MFDTLSERLGGILEKLTRRGALSEADVNEAMREVRRALLEADVALDVIRSFIDKVRAKAVGQDVIRFLPGSASNTNTIAGAVTMSNSGLFELYNAGPATVTIGTLSMVGGIVNVPASTTLSPSGSVFSQFNAANVNAVSPAGASVPGAALITGTGNFSLGGITRTFDVQAGLSTDMIVTPTIVNGAVGFKFSPRLRLVLDVFNLLDAEVSDIDYYFASRLHDEPEPVEDIHFHAAIPRSARLALNVSF